MVLVFGKLQVISKSLINFEVYQQISTLKPTMGMLRLLIKKFNGILYKRLMINIVYKMLIVDNIFQLHNKVLLSLLMIVLMENLSFRGTELLTKSKVKNLLDIIKLKKNPHM